MNLRISFALMESLIITSLSGVLGKSVNLSENLILESESVVPRKNRK